MKNDGEIKAALLAEAARRYPVGTKYENVLDDGIIYESEFAPKWHGVLGIEVSNGGLCYWAGSWAEVIDKINKAK